MTVGRKKVDYTGARFGRVLVLSTKWEWRGSRKRAIVYCICDCGNKCSMTTDSLKTNNVSCGCYRKENCGNIFRTHGLSKTTEYESWASMKRRCYNERCHNYENYGGRGIKVCPSWEFSFENFLKDMGLKPFPWYTLERIDNDGNYCPENCKWADPKEQANNRRPRGSNGRS